MSGNNRIAAAGHSGLSRSVYAISLFAAFCAARGLAAEKPNMIFILADDMGYGDVQCLNPERGKIATPNMDQLAAEGMIFTDAHTSSSVCTPSRYGLMTGRYNWRTKLQGGVLNGFSGPLIPTSRTTVASLLKAQGYKTAMFGKWHLGMDLPKGQGKGHPVDWTGTITGGPYDLGFDTYFGITASLDMPPYIYVEDNHFVGVCTVEKEFHPNRKGPAQADFEAVNVVGDLAEKSAAYIRAQQKTEPFFIYIALPSPHTPIVPSAEWQGKSELGKYGDYMMETDAFVGRIMEELNAAGLAENTLLIVSSDNGCSKAANINALQEKGHFPSAQFRGSKADIWDGGHRVPFIVRWPSLVKAGSHSDAIICLTDYIATAAEIAGATLPGDAGEDSVSFLPALKGQPIQTARKGIINHSIKGAFAYREGKWKLILASGSAGWTAPVKGGAGSPKGQLYDMEADPGETTNLYTSNPEVVDRLLAQVTTYVESGRSTEGPASSNDAQIRLWK
jgi:arylsulfatase A-like enzyme